MLREGSSKGMGNVEFENELPSFSEREREERERHQMSKATIQKKQLIVLEGPVHKRKYIILLYED